MPHEKLDNLVRIGKLKTEAASRDEVAGLVRSGLARLTDAKNATLSQESRFDLAYNGAFLIRHTGNGTLPSMRVTWTLATTNSWKH
jgi:hypothetical protein